MNLTIDASVFVAAARTDEVHYPASRQFMVQMRATGASLYCPILVLPECAAAIARPTGDSVLGQELIALIESIPGLRLVSLELSLAHRAVQVAVHYRLRGADSIYVAVAEAFDATLVTWDVEMLERGANVVATTTPSRWIDEQVVTK